MLSTLRFISEILFRPKKAFKAIIQADYQSYGYFLTLFVVVATIEILSLSINRILISESISNLNLSSDIKTVAESTLNSFRYFGIILTPLLFVGKLYLYAFILKSLVAITWKKVEYRTILYIVAISFFTIVIGEVVNIGLIYLSGLENIHTSYDGFKIGANLFTSTKFVSGIGYIALSYINPFQCWCMYLIALGLRTTYQLRLIYIIPIVILFWIFTVLISLLPYYLSGAFI